MANCAYCNSFILFGGVKVGANTFCNVNCQRNGVYLAIAQKIPQTDVLDMIQRLDRVGCPECNGPGPIEVHVSHTVWSALVLTSWRSTPKVSCRKCGVHNQLHAALLSGLVGWWGFPWGLIMTPVQMGRNIYGMFRVPTHPSPQLFKIVGLNLAAQLVALQQQKAAAISPPLPPLPKPPGSVG